ncbi:GCN5 family acetyltransferase [Rhizobium sp. Leaf384]|uniref:GNAT family N-acetyltransferase n=1 Tax=unclassified Rhizobium TaxID=2613769 RepID=UPI000712CD6A|nr:MULTISPECIES: GNAT family N-acetyltransferase [unclassified Rhizobium]KQR67967.1 GCN5 family acetyltransferase [Rhizobium sp. Leaf341]KQS74486.1 GCN5 family acetyltransferase [Rhizobium sp. Leaf383]KQS80224.1 GCN5 family acetyltransferase [Rhizobium sp. Leaf384]
MTLTIREDSPRQPAIIDLLDQSDAYAQSLYPAESNHLVDLETLEKPGVSFFVARHHGAIVGCCALVAAGDGSGEIKRMFVDPKARGMRAGQALLDAIEQKARASGLTTVRLETGIYQPEAIGLYRKAGYRDIEPFGTYMPDPLSLFMEKIVA